MVEEAVRGSEKAAEYKQCNLKDEIVSLISDWWNTKTTSVNPQHFLGLPDSITIGPITYCDRTTGELVHEPNHRTEHYSEASRRYVSPQ